MTRRSLAETRLCDQMSIPGSKFVDVTELAAHTQTVIGADNASQDRANSAIEQGEFGVISYISPELDTLLERAVTLNARMIRAKTVIEVNESEGPILDASKITSIKIGGVLLASSAYARPHAWAVARSDGDEFAKGDVVEIVYTAGFAIESDGSTNLPSRIKKAILISAADHFVNPDPNMVRERIGDWEKELRGADARQDPMLTVIPLLAQQLLRGWRRPQ